LYCSKILLTNASFLLFRLISCCGHCNLVCLVLLVTVIEDSEGAFIADFDEDFVGDFVEDFVGDFDSNDFVHRKYLSSSS